MPPNPWRIFISGHKHGVVGTIKSELRRRSAIEPVIGHMKNDGHLGRNYLKGRYGDAANAILIAVGHNFRVILAWLRILLPLVLHAMLAAFNFKITREWALLETTKCTREMHDNWPYRAGIRAQKDRQRQQPSNYASFAP